MRVLVLHVHPGQQHSVINRKLAEAASGVEGITVVDLYRRYPQFKIDIDKEQEQLLAHDAIVFQFPIYWYSTPSLLKEWQDLVLEYGFAYGPDGDKLKGKLFFPVVTAGGPEDAYKAEGYNRFSLRTLLAPLEQTATLCQMNFVPPMALFSAHRAREDTRGEAHSLAYIDLLTALRDDRFDLEAAAKEELLSSAALPIKTEA